MKPLHLTLKNFGPFLKEEIDFSKIDNNELFLISGKTGSGKTMIFDAMTYALFGQASTKQREENDLRSHFADGKEAMSVTFQFELNHRVYKLHRQGPYIKEGNTTKTNAKFDVFELVDDKFEIRESKVQAGNQFIIDLIGVNAEQFRQLFILPQGEFKKFLISKSSDKQGILRTLFDSNKFEEVREILKEEVKIEKAQIENRYQQIDLLWQEIETFDNEEIKSLMNISSQQTDRVIENIPLLETHFNQQLNIIYEEKKAATKSFENIEKKTQENKVLQENIKQLDSYKNSFDQLKEKQPEIDQIEEKLKLLQEIKSLLNFIDTKKHIETKMKKVNNAIKETKIKISEVDINRRSVDKEYEALKEKEHTIDEKIAFIDKTKPIKNNIIKYQESFNKVDGLTIENEQIKKELSNLNNSLEEIEITISNNDSNYENIVVLNHEMNQIRDDINTIQENENAKSELSKLMANKQELEMSINKERTVLSDLEIRLEKFDKSKLDLNDKESFIREIKSAVKIGEQCPICGNEIHDLGEHIDFESIAKRKADIKEIETKISSIKSSIAVKHSEMNHINEKISNINVDEHLDISIEILNEQLIEKEAELNNQIATNKYVEELKSDKEKLTAELHQKQLLFNRNESELKLSQQLIIEFETLSEYHDISDFEADYNRSIQEVNAHQELSKQIENKLTKLTQQRLIEENNLNHYNQQSATYNNDLKENEQAIEIEMTKLNLSHDSDVEGIMTWRNEKESLKKTVDEYRKQYNELELEINRLESLIKGKVVINPVELEKDYQKCKENLNALIDKYSAVHYQCENNVKKLKAIESHINYLNQELKEQQQIFQLSEIVSGKNNKNLTLENFVLIYYLDKIIAQANIRLATMTDNRYQLIRREAVSQGLSGLAIDVFDLHSNKSRHISSLSGGETFQSSLALALGMSEIVQQQSGGISLESIFIDEGFGTLDQETLETALDTLLNLKSTGRMVGIISHVTELKNRIPLVLEVKSNQYQSSTIFRRN
ncbi:exonuclease subunit SbcC [Staphylococcus schweitzeri]|uniref:exonuclease subunit SbcC n=1 Tax=Staphylococcus schweitzeri TaxID=1654388 RepID=UPI0005029E04|nr:exonuclease subunit SbcC [Staphylococcus schweitzeri]CDR24620.1 Nuclease sbcCD subunit C [Staphylococcus schweitzeri]